MWFFRLLFALAVTTAVPLAGYFMSDHMIVQINANLAAQGFPPFEVVCAMPEAEESAFLRVICLDLATLPLLNKVSIAAALSGIGFLAFLMITAIFIGKSRTLLATLFPVIVQISLYYIVLSALLQGAVLTLVSYVGQSFYLGRVRLYLVALVAAAVLVAAYKLLEGVFEYGGRLRTRIDGIALNETKAPGLFKFVRDIAEKLGAQTPENIVVGLQPNFFATSSEITTGSSMKPLTGSTLYLSLPLSQLLTVSEFAAVVGHELGHFRGDDTEFSLKFTPVYAGLAEAVTGLGRKETELVRPGAPTLSARSGFSSVANLVHRMAKVPARAVLAFMMDVFAMNVRAIGYQRELLADKAGAEASSAHALVMALTKASLYADIWQEVLNENIERLHRGKATRNLSSVLTAKVRYDLDEERLAKTVAEAGKRRTPHPTDRHPTIAERMKALGVDAGTIDIKDMAVPENTAGLLFRNAKGLAETLSVMEQKQLAELGLAPPTGRGTGGAGRHLSAIYRIAIAMFGPEGRMSEQQMRVAEAAGKELFEGFEITDFRQNCDYVEEIPEMEFIAEELNELLDQNQKRAVVDYLTRIASSGGEMGVGEQVYIEAVAEELKLGAG